MEEDYAKQMMVIVALDGSTWIPKRKTQGCYIKEFATRLDALAPRHQGFAGDAQIAKVDLTLALIGL